MRTSQDVVRELKAVLFENAPITPAALTALAQEYSQLCTDASRRLEECGQLIGRGQTAEALYGAEASPTLLEQVSILDFGGVEKWLEYARARQLPCPQRFAAHLVQLVSGIYERQTAIEPLINEYRRKCIKGAPALERIAILRRLRQADPQNPDWLRDEQGLEMHWIKEMSDLVQQRGDRLAEEQLALIQAELTGGQLLIRPAEGFTGQVGALLTQHRQERCREVFARLGTEANQAYSAGDWTTLADRLAQIETLVRREQTPIPPEIEPTLVDARAWQAEQMALRTKTAAFEADVQRLRNMLTAAKKPEELERVINLVQAHHQPLPDNLIERARMAVRKLQKARSRQLGWLISAGVAGLLIVAFGTTLVVMRNNESRARDELLQRIAGATQKQDYLAGRKLIDQLRKKEPDKLGDPRLETAVLEFEKAEKTWLVQNKEWERLCTELAGMEANDPAVDPKLTQAIELAKTPEQTLRVQKLKTEIAAQRAVRQKDRDEQLKKLLEQAVAALDKVRKSSDPDERKTLLSDAGTILLRADNVVDVSTVLVDQRRQHQLKYQDTQRWVFEQDKKEENQLQAKKQLYEDLKKARSLLPDLKAYVAAREALSNKYPDAVEVGGANDWQNTLDTHLAMVEMGRGLELCQKRQPGGPRGPQSRESFKDFRELVLKNQPAAITPYTPVTKPLQERLTLLAAFDKKAKDLLELLKDPVVAGLYETRVRQGDKMVRYYLPTSQPGLIMVNGRQKLTFKVYDQNHGEKTSPMLEPDAVLEPPHLAPHCLLAREILTGLEEEKTKPDWFSGLPALVMRAAGGEQANPTVQALLIQGLIKLDGELGNSLQLPDSLKNQADTLTAGEVKFMAPDDEKVNVEQAATAQRIKQFSQSLSEHLAGLEKKRKHRLAELAGLWRPLAVSGTVELDLKGVRKVVPLEGEGATEFWAIVLMDNRPNFLVAAVRDENKRLIWLDDNQVTAVGQPLFSPVDHRNTRSLYQECREMILPDQPLSCWPVNLDKMPGK